VLEAAVLCEDRRGVAPGTTVGVPAARLSCTIERLLEAAVVVVAAVAVVEGI
jgi:hypothetical protein